MQAQRHAIEHFAASLIFLTRCRLRMAIADRETVLASILAELLGTEKAGGEAGGIRPAGEPTCLLASREPGGE
jgi:hypothetical protein